MMSISVNKQTGGTLVGLIIGLVIGLGIAIAVAFIITKTSTPFTNKLGMSKTPETPEIQLTDPNKPLYGHSYQEPAPNQNNESFNEGDALPDMLRNSFTHSPEASDEISDQAQAGDAENKSDENSKAAKSSDTAKNNADEKAAYYLQVGAFRDADDAENVRAKLALLGIESSVSTKNTNGGTDGDQLYRVRIGPFDRLDAMNRMRSKLSENSIDVAVIKTPK